MQKLKLLELSKEKPEVLVRTDRQVETLLSHPSYDALAPMQIAKNMKSNSLLKFQFGPKLIIKAGQFINYPKNQVKI